MRGKADFVETVMNSSSLFLRLVHDKAAVGRLAISQVGHSSKAGAEAT